MSLPSPHGRSGLISLRNLNPFRRQAVGLTVTDQLIEVAQVAARRSRRTVRSVGRIALPAGAVENGRVADVATVTDALQQAFTQAEPKAITTRHVVMALPTAYSYTRLVPVSKQKSTSHEEAAAQAVRTTVPVAAGDAIFSFVPLSQHDAKGTVSTVLLVVATSRTLATGWHDVLHGLKRDVSFDVGPLAVWRTLSLAELPTPVGVVDMSRPEVTISVFDEHVLRYSYGRHFVEDEAVFADISSEVRDALRHTPRRAEAVVVVPPTAEAAEHVVAQLGKQLKVPVGSAETRLVATQTASLQTAGLALRALEPQWNAGHPLLTLTSAHSVPEPTDTASPDANEEHNAQTVITATAEARRLRRQKMILIGVAVLGLVTVAGAYWFRTQEKAEQAAEREAQEVNYTDVQAITVTVSVASEEQHYQAERVAGRIASYTIENSGSYQEAVANAKRSAESNLSEGEYLWETPLNEPDDPSEVEFPLEVRWLIYPKAEADQLLLAEVEALNTNDVPFALNTTRVVAVSSSDEAGLYTLRAELTVSVNERLVVPSPSPLAPSPSPVADGEEGDASEEVQQIVILDTPVGYLNIRGGPGTEFEQIGRAAPGDTYVVTGGEEEWFEIQLAGDATGWVSIEFVELTSVSETSGEVRILDTPVGYLNVRSEPDLSAEQVGRVAPGDVYAVLDVLEDWYQIELPGDESGWVFAEFASLE